MESVDEEEFIYNGIGSTGHNRKPEKEIRRIDRKHTAEVYERRAGQKGTHYNRWLKMET